MSARTISPQDQTKHRILQTPVRASPCCLQSSSRCRPAIRPTLPVLLALVPILAGLTGCFSARTKDHPTAPAHRAKSRSALETEAPVNAVYPRLGLIEQVSPGATFVLIDIGTAPAPPAGTRLQTFFGAVPNAHLVVSAHQKRPFLIADIVSGTPQAGDSVSLILDSRSSIQEEPAGREGRVP